MTLDLVRLSKIVLLVAPVLLVAAEAIAKVHHGDARLSYLIIAGCRQLVRPLSVPVRCPEACRVVTGQ